jgi:hypothetical protein
LHAEPKALQEEKKSYTKEEEKEKKRKAAGLIHHGFLATNNKRGTSVLYACNKKDRVVYAVDLVANSVIFYIFL